MVRLPDHPVPVACSVIVDEQRGDEVLLVRVESSGELRTDVAFADVERLEPDYLAFLDADVQIARINETMFMCTEGGESSVYALLNAEPQVGLVDLSRPLVLERMSVRSFRVMYGNVTVRIVSNGKTK